MTMSCGVLCLLVVLSVAAQLGAVGAFEIPSLSRWRGPSPQPKHRLPSAFRRSPKASAQPQPLGRLSLSVQALAREDSGDGTDGFPAKSALVRIADRYNCLLASHPRCTQIASSVLVGGLGDVLLQALSALKQRRPVSIDAHRLAVFCAVSGCYFAPVVGSWFALLNRLSLSLPGRSPSQRALLMTIVDQTLGAVAVNAGFFVAFELIQALFQPRSLSVKTLQRAVEAGIVSMRRNMWRTLVGNWCCWPALNFVNFLYVPPSLRLLFSNVAAVFWNMFISSVANG